MNRFYRSLVSILAVLIASPLSGQSVCSAPWTLEETLLIGSIDGEVTLSWVRDLEIGPNGDIYVAQGWDHSVAVFGSDGRPERTVGRSGSGPGEFAAAPTQLFWRSDTLVVTERFATHFFREDGTEVRQVQFQVRMRPESSTFVPGAPLADGSFLGYRLLNPPLRVFYEAPQLALRRFSATGHVIDTIAVVRQPPVVGDEAFRDEFQNRTLTHPLAWWTGDSRLPVMATKDGSGVVLIGDVHNDGEPASFDLLKIGIAGDTLVKHSIAYTPRRITDAERDEVRDGFAAYWAGDFLGSSDVGPSSGTRERLRRVARRALTFPESYPPVRQIITGSDGSIWLLRESAPAPADLWEIYSENGAFEGSVSVSEGRTGPEPWAPRLRIYRATRNQVWGTTSDDLDVPYLHRYRVDRSCH